MCSFLLYQLWLDYKPLWEGSCALSIKLCPLPCMSPETQRVSNVTRVTTQLPWLIPTLSVAGSFWQQVEK